MTREGQPMRELKLLRVLMAEDDKVNQALAKGLFKRIGCEYDIAESGRIVLEKLQLKTYDIILMDIEMPDLNGYQTTFTIRNTLTGSVSQIPILAITAHVQDNDLKKCFDVGMNDYLLKPLKLEELTTKMYAAVNGVTGEGVRIAQPENDNVQKTNMFSIESLSTACGNNPVTVKNVIKIFIAQNSINVSQLKEIVKVKDRISLKNLCHKMKSVYALIGLPGVKAQLEEIEDDCAKDKFNVAKFEAYIKQIEQLHIDILPELKKALNEN
jgi:CheY-like chemotaxis protein